MADYFLAPSLVTFRASINAAFPKRDKSSDGWIGDPAHAARPSEHNPCWTCTGYQHGIVRAIDVDVDDGDAGRDLRRMILNSAMGHRAVWYVISNGIIYSRTHGWKALRYTGTNGHFHHVHISIQKTLAAAKDTTLVLVTGVAGKPPSTGSGGGGGGAAPKVTISISALQYATKGGALAGTSDFRYNDVAAFLAWCARLTKAGGAFVASANTIGVWERAVRQGNYAGAGRELRQVVLNLQSRYHLVKDGVFGPNTAALMSHDGFVIRP